MTRQNHPTGQTVSVAFRSLSGPRTTHLFRIVRRYVIENGTAMYHVRAIGDRDERMVPEGELTTAMPDISDRSDEQYANVFWLSGDARLGTTPSKQAVAR